MTVNYTDGFVFSTVWGAWVSKPIVLSSVFACGQYNWSWISEITLGDNDFIYYMIYSLKKFNYRVLKGKLVSHVNSLTCLTIAIIGILITALLLQVLLFYEVSTQHCFRQLEFGETIKGNYLSIFLSQNTCLKWKKFIKNWTAITKQS